MNCDEWRRRAGDRQVGEVVSATGLAELVRSVTSELEGGGGTFPHHTCSLLNPQTARPRTQTSLCTRARQTLKLPF